MPKYFQKDLQEYIWQENFYEAFKPLSKLSEQNPSDSLLFFWKNAASLALDINTHESKKNIYMCLHSKPEAYYFLGKYYYKNMIFDSAYQFLDSFLVKVNQSHKYSARAKTLFNSLFDAMMLRNDSVATRLELLKGNINSDENEYAPVVSYLQDKIYFTTKSAKGKSSKKDENGFYYEDISVAYKNDKGEWIREDMLDSRLNTNEHDACLSLSADGKSMIIYRTDPYSGEGDLYIVHKGRDSWQAPIKLGLNINTEHKETSACLSADGNTIYFSSIRPGGMGGLDIYKSTKNKNGVWGEAKNLGYPINTPKDEENPVLSADEKTIFFASNGHKPNMGGFDLYFAKYDSNSNKWSKPENLKYPFNTVNDDLYLSPSVDLQTFYLSTARQGTQLQDIGVISHSFEKPKIKHLILKLNCDTQNKKIIDIIVKDHELNKTLFDSYAYCGETVSLCLPLKKNIKIIVIQNNKSQSVLIDNSSIESFTEQNLEFILEE